MSSRGGSTPVGGRPRDPELEERILEAARRIMAERGYQGLSIGAVAQAAGTTRPTVYLRFAGKEDLATQSIATMTVEEPLPHSEDLRADLVAELRHFRTGVTRPHGMAFVGTVLAEERQTPGLIAWFRQRLVQPRRDRLIAALERGRRVGALRADLDPEALAAALIGSLYAHYLAHGEIPTDWPERVVTALWPALSPTGS